MVVKEKTDEFRLNCGVNRRPLMKMALLEKRALDYVDKPPEKEEEDGGSDDAHEGTAVVFFHNSTATFPLNLTRIDRCTHTCFHFFIWW